MNERPAVGSARRQYRDEALRDELRGRSADVLRDEMRSRPADAARAELRAGPTAATRAEPQTRPAETPAKAVPRKPEIPQ